MKGLLIMFFSKGYQYLEHLVLVFVQLRGMSAFFEFEKLGAGNIMSHMFGIVHGDLMIGLAVHNQGRARDLFNRLPGQVEILVVIIP